MKIMVLGGSGMLGHRVAAVLSDRHEITATLRAADPLAEAIAPQASFVHGVTADDFESVRRAFSRTRPDAVVNCIGVIKQRPEAHDAVASIRANALFPHEVAEMCEAAGARFVHISTDCVFTGTRGNYTEDDPPDATDLYGRTKLLGEVNDVTGAVTVRTSMIGWELHGGRSLLEWFAAQRGSPWPGYARAVFSGLATSDLTRVIGRLCTDWTDVDGLWHVSMEPINKFDLLTGLRDALGWEGDVVPVDEPVIDRSLDSSRFRDRTGWRPPSWDDALSALAAEHSQYESLHEHVLVTGSPVSA